MPDPALTLWRSAAAAADQEVEIALREKGLVFAARDPGGPDFAAASPFGETPALRDAGFAVFGGRAILEYLEQKHPKPDLLPDNPRLAAKARMIGHVMASRYAPALAADADLAPLHDWLEAQLAGAWFCPPHFGWADLSAVCHLAAGARVGRGLAADRPLADWFARACDRPSVAEVLFRA